VNGCFMRMRSNINKCDVITQDLMCLWKRLENWNLFNKLFQVVKFQLTVTMIWH